MNHSPLIFLEPAGACIEIVSKTTGYWFFPVLELPLTDNRMRRQHNEFTGVWRNNNIGLCKKLCPSLYVLNVFSESLGGICTADFNFDSLTFSYKS